MITKTKKIIEIFTDGACKGNPGPGGWGAILRYDNHKKCINGYSSLTTNNQMELTAVICALNIIKKPSNISITTDSQYVKLGITKWIKTWQKNNWHTSNKKPVKNLDLWQQLIKATSKHKISWHWVKGHSGHNENELADKLANDAINNYNNNNKINK